MYILMQDEENRGEVQVVRGKEMRRLEAKVAGLEARILGLAEDSTAEGRVWRASLCAKALETSSEGA